MKNLVDEEALTDALHEFLRYPSKIGYVGRLRKAIEIYEQAKLDKATVAKKEIVESWRKTGVPHIDIANKLHQDSIECLREAIEPPKVPELIKRETFIKGVHQYMFIDVANATKQLIDCVNYLMNKGER